MSIEEKHENLPYVKTGVGDVKRSLGYALWW